MEDVMQCLSFKIVQVSDRPVQTGSSLSSNFDRSLSVSELSLKMQRNTRFSGLPTVCLEIPRYLPDDKYWIINNHIMIEKIRQYHKLVF